MPPPKDIDNYALFLFCGILPWTWFSASLLAVVQRPHNGRKPHQEVMFPAEILPIVTVLSNLVHFLLGLPILVAFLIYFDAPIELAELPWFPVALLVQLLLTLGLALILAALTVHFRDLKDIWQRDDVVVLRHADHLLLEKRAGEDSALPQFESVHASGDHLSGDSVFPGRSRLRGRPARALEVAAGARPGLGGAVPVRLFPVPIGWRDSFAEEV